MSADAREEKYELFSKAVERNDFVEAAVIFIELHEELDIDFQLTKYEAETWRIPLILIGIIIDQIEELSDRLVRISEKPSERDLLCVLTLAEKLPLRINENANAEALKRHRRRTMEVFGCQEETQEALYKALLEIYLGAKMDARQT